MESVEKNNSEVAMEASEKPSFKTAMHRLIQQQIKLLEEHEKTQNQVSKNSSNQAVLCQLLHPDAKLPLKATLGSAGFDLHSVEDITIPPGKYKAVKTGIMFQCPPNYYGKISGRSGLAFKENIFVFEGTLDSDYQNEVSILMNNNSKTKPKSISVGDRIAQIVFIKIHDDICLQVTSSLKKSKREGFGSTGK